MRRPSFLKGNELPRLGALSLALLVSLAGCSGHVPQEPPRDTTSPPLLPMSIHGMPVTAVATGEDAEALIRRLHGKEVAPEASYVGWYEGGGSTATLYVSHFQDVEFATAAVRDMSSALETGSQTFAHHKRFAMDTVLVHAVIGQGQAHFFFVRGQDVLWLAVDYDMARIGLADLLGIPLDRVPDGLVLGGVDVLPPPDSLYPRPGLGAFVRRDGR